MKQKDFALIAVIVFISAIVSLFASKALFNDNKASSKEAEKVTAITSDFPAPDNRYFNTDSIDPTKTITIQQNDNTNPFSGTSAQ